MAKFKLPSGVVVETSDEVGSRIYGASSAGSSPQKKAPAKKAAPKKKSEDDSEK